MLDDWVVKMQSAPVREHHRGRRVTIFVKHPLYTSVALLVLPWLGFLLDTWLGALIGIVLYVASRLLAPGEEADLAGQFGPEWDAYCRRVKVPRL
jgi:protein-S-isoprenylcysteine O-methyltransferase Ste14